MTENSDMKVSSNFSFDFEYGGELPEDSKEFLGKPSQGNTIGGHGHGPSYFGFEVDVPMDSEGDFIFPDETLDEITIYDSISTVGRVVGTFKLAFIKFVARNKRIGDIEMLSRYIHLRLVDLAFNRIRNVSALTPMKYLQVLNLEENRIPDVASLPQFLYLQALNLAKNDLSTTIGFQKNLLAYLSLSKNRLTILEGFTGENFPNLLYLELRENQLTTLRGIELPKLESLYIAGNQLTDLAGLKRCPNLKLIHARQNLIEKLNKLSTCTQLDYINLRDNRIDRLTQLTKLGKCKNLKTAVFSNNPIANDEKYRLETIAACSPSLRRLDKYLISQIEQVNGTLLRTAREVSVVTATAPTTRASSIATFESSGDGGGGGDPNVNNTGSGFTEEISQYGNEGDEEEGQEEWMKGPSNF